MLKVSQNDEKHYAKFCGKYVEMLKLLKTRTRARNGFSRIPLRSIRQGAKAPFKPKER
jgi:hypothetical protein